MSSEADILLTGASSFVGGHVLRRFAQSGAKIVATTRSGVGHDDPLRQMKNVEIIHLELDDERAFQCLPNRISTVVHIAAVSDEDAVKTITRSNIEGMQNLLDYALQSGAKRFIFASSLSVHGDITHHTVDSDTLIVNPDAYGLSKRMGEFLLGEVAVDLPSVAIRLPGVIGRGAKRNWLAGVLDKALKGETITIFNPEDPFNNAVDVTNLADFMLHLAYSDIQGAQVFPVASAGFTTIEGAVRTIIKNTGSTSAVEVIAADKTSFVIDIAQAEKLGFKPTGIEEALACFCEQEQY